MVCTIGVYPFPRRRISEPFLPGGRLVGGVATPDLGGGQVAVSPSYATSSCRAISAPYSPGSGKYRDHLGQLPRTPLLSSPVSREHVGVRLVSNCFVRYS